MPLPPCPAWISPGILPVRNRQHSTAVAIPEEPCVSRIAVVVVNHNTRDLLRDCLRTVPPDASVVVIDNASNDGSAAMVAAEFPRFRLVASVRNAGYGAAANEAVRACEEEYVLVLNSD